MAFFTFDQNNTGGSFDHSAEGGIGPDVCIEAHSAKEANARAQIIGIYFDGCAIGSDCPCCGDRWYKVAADDATDAPEKYKKPLTGSWGHPAYIHYLDGRIEPRPVQP